MAGRGFPPTPTELKILKGNPGRRPLNRDEPKPPVAIPTAPDFLDEEALTEWQRITPELERVGLVTRLDRAGLTAYCVAWSDYARARRTGSAKQRMAAFTQLRQVLAEFGLSPASRSRIHVDSAPPQSDLQRFMEKHGK